MEVVIAIQIGINHTSNACKIIFDQQKEWKDFNVPFATQSNGIQSVTTPTSSKLTGFRLCLLRLENAL